MKLCVVTDIYTQPTATGCLLADLLPEIQVARYRLNTLSGRPDLSGSALHSHLFNDGGIDTAARALADTLRPTDIGLGYSAGGTALWRAAALEAPMASLICISSTRLRSETALAIPNHVLFGANDPNRPSAEWLTTIPARWTLLNSTDHDYYRDPTSQPAIQTRNLLAPDIREALRT